MRKTESTRRVRWHHSRIVGTSRLAIAASTLLLLTSVVQAAPEIVIGVHDLLPDTANQIVTLNLITADQPVRGMNVRAELGDGLGPGIEPIFSGATYTSTVWDAFPTTTLGGPVEGAEQFLQSSVNFSDTGLSVLPNGPVVHLLISTVGIHSGDFPLSLNSPTIAEPTDLIVPGGGTVALQTTAGLVRIVPEPNAIGVLLFLTGALAVSCRQKPM